MELDFPPRINFSQGLLGLTKKPFVRSDELGALSPAPSKSKASRSKSQLHTVLGWLEFLFVHLVDHHRNFLNVFLSSNISQRLARHSVVAHVGDIRINGQKYASMGGALNGVGGVLAHGSCFLSRCV